MAHRRISIQTRARPSRRATQTAAASAIADSAPGRLTPAERRVLQHLPSHLSNAEIAARLLVATTTVKTQVSSIYRKLGVRKRSQAVDVARGLQLLDDQPHRRAVEDR